MQGLTQIGMTVFSREKYLQISEKGMIPIQIMRMLNKADWKINKNEYISKSWNQIFEGMRSTQILKLQIELTYHNKVINQICHLKFHQLSELNLAVNSIFSIEALSSLNAPFLQKLRLSHNYIVSLKPIRKLQTKYIRELFLEGNNIKQTYILTLVSFFKQIDTLSLENWGQKQVQDGSLNFLAKLNSRNIIRIVCKSERRIKQSVIEEKMKKRYKNVTIQVK